MTIFGHQNSAGQAAAKNFFQGSPHGRSRLARAQDPDTIDLAQIVESAFYPQHIPLAPDAPSHCDFGINGTQGRRPDAGGIRAELPLRATRIDSHIATV